MIINYLPYIFGLISFFGGLYLFLISFKIYTPKGKTEEEKIKFGTLMKIGSIVLILSGSYDLIKRDPDRYRIGKGTENSNWTSEDRKILIGNCIRDARTTATNYPQITSDYCECTIDKIMTAMTKEQYEKSLRKPQIEQLKEQLPIFQDCVNELKRRIDSTDQKANVK